MKVILFKFLVPIITFILCFLLIELILSFSYPKNNNYYIGKPFQKHSFSLDTAVLRGTSPLAKISYNSLGARSDEISENNLYKIITFGGSTTECVALDQEKTWTELLEKSLNKNNDSTLFWVGNFGKSGNGTNHHILQTELMLQNDRLSDAKIVLFLIGFNDLNMSLQNTELYSNPDNQEINLSSFMIIPDKDLPLYRRTAIWKFLKHTNYQMGLNSYTKEELVKAYNEVRTARLSSKKKKQIPNLDIGLKHYKKNINHLIQLCKAKSKVPIFLTQPVLWRPNISEESENILYTFFKDQNNLDTETLYESMKIFNDALIEVCSTNDIQYIDLFKYSEENWFYDDCHLNEKGAYEVSKIISNQIKL